MNEEYGFMLRTDAMDWVTAHEEEDRFMLVEPISGEKTRLSGMQLKTIICGSGALITVTAGKANVWVVRLVPRVPLHHLIGYRCDIPFFILARHEVYASTLNRYCDQLLHFSGRWLARGGIKEEDSVVELLTRPEIYYKKIEDAYASANAETHGLIG